MYYPQSQAAFSVCERLGCYPRAQRHVCPRPVKRETRDHDHVPHACHVTGRVACHEPNSLTVLCLRRLQLEPPAENIKSKQFRFNILFEPEATQEDVLNHSGW